MSEIAAIIGVEQEPRVQFTLALAGRGMPDIIKLHDGSLIMKVGAYASPGNQWCYRRVNEVRELTSFCHVVPWEEYSGLKGSPRK